jgi:polysaccharide deacetylase family protein (PEP-CTERM system associated)
MSTDMRANGLGPASGHGAMHQLEWPGRVNGQGRGLTPACVLTFDVEEWFQVENLRGAFPRAHWELLPRRTLQTMHGLLDLLAVHDIRATFFVLGWLAEREPGLVREIVAGGHELACHGYGHVMPMQLTRTEFRDDLLLGRQVLEQIGGTAVSGYRAPSFSLDEGHLRMLAEHGFRYDSSFHPFSLHGRYGRLTRLGRPLRPGVYRLDGGLVELGLPVERLGPAPVPISGGGYFRILPGALFRRLVKRAITRDGHYLMYLHSWEFDPAQPRVSRAPLGLRFRHYHNLHQTLPRMQRLITMLRSLDVRFSSASQLVDEITGHATA